MIMFEGMVLRCTKCNVVKPDNHFYRSVKGASRRHRQSWCRPCSTRKGLYSGEHRYRRYRRTQAWYDEKLEKQGGRCAICGAQDNLPRKVFSVDHDHACCPERSKSCGKCVRGLLCTRCNTGLGAFRDDDTIMLAAMEYLATYR